MIRSSLLLAMLLIAGFAAADDDPALDDPALNQRYWALIREIRCPLCKNESIAESGAPIAADLRREVKRRLVGGASDEEIKEFLVERYGDFILYRTRFTPETWALWLGPFVFLAVGGFAFWRVLRVRRGQTLDDEPLDEGPPP
ncbi:MAG TPA: cytochrome c-type biogenesis protein [Gammaproteobacteria bacterium]|nr:cytochrome c-type biogenesis protein [Gammaproteobacteria bacterium]